MDSEIKALQATVLAQQKIIEELSIELKDFKSLKIEFYSDNNYNYWRITSNNYPIFETSFCSSATIYLSKNCIYRDGSAIGYPPGTTDVIECIFSTVEQDNHENIIFTVEIANNKLFIIDYSGQNIYNPFRYGRRQMPMSIPIETLENLIENIIQKHPGQKSVLYNALEHILEKLNDISGK